MDTVLVQKGSAKYNCVKCNYTTERKSQYERHNLTSKHKRIHENTDNSSNKFKSYICDKCNNEYKFHSGLWKHKKTCNKIPHTIKATEINTNEPANANTMLDNPSLMVELLKQNQEFKQLLIDQNKQMMEMAGNMVNMGNTVNNNTNNVNSHNKFNLNVFLNEDCKNAMSLTDFVNSMNLTIEDFIQTGELGFVDGISKVMVERIHNMDLHDRPVHCTDLKRETVYIKDRDKWEKDDDKVRLRKAVNNVAKDNRSLTSEWMEATPDVNTSGTANYENFFKYSQSALGGMGTDKNKAFEDKIMKNIMKETTIDRGQSTE